MARDLSSSRAILIGNGTFDDTQHIPAVPASGCVAAMLDLLTSDLCGWPRDRVDVFEDVAAPSDLARNLVRAVRGAETMLLVYYVGHGLLTMKGHLALALRGTDPDPEALPHTSMLYENLASILRGSPAATKLIILDCCYAETANQANFGTQSAGLTDAYPVDGLYFIGASKRREKAGFPLHGDQTYFTEAFIDTVRTGIPGQPPASELTLSEIFRVLRGRLAAEGLPEPADSGIRDARQYPFAVNAACRTVPQVHAQADPAREARRRILDHAERAAVEITRRSLPPPGQGGALAILAVAAAVAADDPDHARRLTSQAMRLVAGSSTPPSDMVHIARALVPLDAERANRVAGAITDQSFRNRALEMVAGAAAVVAPDCAERAANAIGTESKRDSSLAGIARALLATSPEQAERIAGTIRQPSTRAGALTQVATAIAASDPPHAVSIAAAISGHVSGFSMLKLVAAIADADLDAAENIAVSVTDNFRDMAMREVARAAAFDPERAKRIIAAISDPNERADAGYLVARRRSKDDPVLAESIARTIAIPSYRVSALNVLASDLAKTDPDGAARLLGDAEQLCRSITDQAERGRARGYVAASVAAADPDHAMRLARSITDKDARDEALRQVAIVAAVARPEDSQHIATAISDPYTRGNALCQAAWAAAGNGHLPAARQLLQEAERQAGAIRDLRQRADLFAYLADQLAAVNPDDARRALDEAEIVARTVPDGPGFSLRKPSDEALLHVVRMMTARSTTEAARHVLRDHTERIARAIPGPDQQAEALTAFATSVFSDDNERAERAILAIRSPEARVNALINIAKLHSSSP